MTLDQACAKVVSILSCGLVTDQRNVLKLQLQLIPSDGPDLATSDASPGRHKCPLIDCLKPALQLALDTGALKLTRTS